MRLRMEGQRIALHKGETQIPNFSTQALWDVGRLDICLCSAKVSPDDFASERPIMRIDLSDSINRQQLFKETADLAFTVDEMNLQNPVASMTFIVR
jgi:hypothetical protein